MKHTNSFEGIGSGEYCTAYKWLLLVVFLLMSFHSMAQIVVQGTVSDPNGIPIAGASVIVKNTSNGVVSGFDGIFQVSVSSTNAVLTVSSIGFETYEIAVWTQTHFNEVLKENLQEFGEVVVIGYGTQKRADVTSAVSTVKAEDFVKGNVKDAAQLIQGKVAGLTISAPSGDPTEGTQIKLRGVSSLTGG